VRDGVSFRASDKRIRHQGGASTSTHKRDFAADSLQMQKRVIAAAI
jgi:hypothetical protein